MEEKLLVQISPISRKPIIVEDPPKFDLDTYISGYKGRTRFERLFLIGKCSTFLTVDAFKLAVKEAKQNLDILRYDAAVSALREVSPDDKAAIPDTQWRTATEAKGLRRTELLESELKGYKNNLIKESIRMGNDDLANCYHAVGNLSAATRMFNRTKDFCIIPSQAIPSYEKLIEISVERKDWVAVLSFASKLANVIEKPDSRCAAAKALAWLGNGQYNSAATSFLEADISLGDSFSNVITCSDIAIYGSLCALATMNRDELSKSVLNNVKFRKFLELEPHIRKAITLYCNCRYSHCLRILDSYKCDYLLDLYLQHHVERLFESIRTKSIVEYISPFSSLQFSTLESAFPSSSKYDSIADELVDLIQSGKLDARLDMPEALLLVHKPDKRGALYHKTRELAENYKRALNLLLLRANMAAAGVVVQHVGMRSNMEVTGPEGAGDLALPQNINALPASLEASLGRAA